MTGGGGSAQPSASGPPIDNRPKSAGLFGSSSGIMNRTNTGAPQQLPQQQQANAGQRYIAPSNNTAPVTAAAAPSNGLSYGAIKNRFLSGNTAPVAGGPSASNTAVPMPSAGLLGSNGAKPGTAGSTAPKPAASKLFSLAR